MSDSTGPSLRALLSEGQLVVAPGVYDGLSAHLARRMGFSAAYLTGAGVAAAGFGLPDIGLVTGSEMAERARMVCGVLEGIPVIADADTGYGSPLNVVRTVRDFEWAGVAAIQIEDQAFPKRCGHLPDKELLSESDYMAKLGAAIDARQEALIVARTDARAVLGLSAAIDRANAYAEAGADIVFVEAPQDEDEIERIAKEVEAPLMINIVQGGLTPDLPPERLAAMGYQIAIHPSNPLVNAADAMVTALARIGGTPPKAEASGIAEFFELVGLRHWQTLGETWARS